LYYLLIIGKHNTRRTPLVILRLKQPVRPAKLKWWRLSAACAILLQLAALTNFNSTTAKAESFSATPFQQQWSATDAQVANGQVKRTFFWGLQPFAHTQEVYSQSVSGTREVQYFDKGRMELTTRVYQDDTISNGLLTVELVSGRMQVGDTDFIQHQPATNPVAGDPSNNPDCPTYASFNQGKLAYGTFGASVGYNRSAETIDESVNKDGVVSKLTQYPVALKYGAFIDNTQHNIADVFYNFFLADPLSDSKWVAVMGLPITEPYWIDAVVAGTPRKVLVQLFERRALTYTPTNPAGFQVEMANIGQHYYSWRYQVNVQNDQLPGNYRMIIPKGQSLLSSSIYKADSFSLGDAPAAINGLWASNHGLAVVGTTSTPLDHPENVDAIYLADLTKPSQFESIPLGPQIGSVFVSAVAWSADRQRLVVVSKGSGQSSTSKVQVYQLSGNSISNSFVAYQGAVSVSTNFSNQAYSLSANGRYLAIVADQSVLIIDLDKKSAKQVAVNYTYTKGCLPSWVNSTDQMLVKSSLLDAATGNLKALVKDADWDCGSISPDGNYLATFTYPNSASSNSITVALRSLLNPDQAPLTPSKQLFYDSDGVSSKLGSWATDSSFITIDSVVHESGGYNAGTLAAITSTSGRTVAAYNYSFISYATPGKGWINRVGPHYIMNRTYNPYPNNSKATGGIDVYNTDGSNHVSLISDANVIDYRIDQAQVVQVTAK
jgi:hypothetical protein